MNLHVCIYEINIVGLSARRQNVNQRHTEKLHNYKKVTSSRQLEFRYIKQRVALPIAADTRC